MVGRPRYLWGRSRDRLGRGGASGEGDGGENALADQDRWRPAVNFFSLLYHEVQHRDFKMPTAEHVSTRRFFPLDNLRPRCMGGLRTVEGEDGVASGRVVANPASVQLPEGDLRGEQRHKTTRSRASGKCSVCGGYQRESLSKGVSPLEQGRIHRR